MQTARDADLDKFVFGSTTNDCLQQLQMKFLADDPALTRVVLRQGGRWGREDENADALSYDRIEIRETGDQAYDGSDVKEAMLIGQRVGSVKIESQLLRGNEAALLEAGFKTPHGGYRYWGYTVLRYDPEGAKKLGKARKTRERSRPVKAEEFWPVYHALQPEIYASGISLTYRPGAGYDCIIPALMAAISHFNWIFGNNAHRRVEAFRTLKQQWKEREPQTVKLLRMDNSKYDKYRGTSRRTFCNWMSEEVKVRNVPLHTGKWIPLRKMPDFEDFTDEKRKKAMATAKKAAKKAAKKVTKKASKKPAKKAVAKKGVKTSKKRTAKKPAAKKAASKSQVIQDDLAVVGGEETRTLGEMLDLVDATIVQFNTDTDVAAEDRAIAESAD
jgi:hypothetical protein